MTSNNTFAFGCLANHGTRIAHWLPYQNHSSSCDLIIHCSKSCTNLLEPLPNQQHTIKDKEESQDLECLNPAMSDMIHTMKKTNYSRSKQSRVFLYTETYRLNSQCRIFCGTVTTSMLPPDCRATRTQTQAPNP